MDFTDGRALAGETESVSVQTVGLVFKVEGCHVETTQQRMTSGVRVTGAIQQASAVDESMRRIDNQVRCLQ